MGGRLGRLLRLQQRGHECRKRNEMANAHRRDRRDRVGVTGGNVGVRGEAVEEARGGRDSPTMPLSAIALVLLSALLPSLVVNAIILGAMALACAAVPEVRPIGFTVLADHS